MGIEVAGGNDAVLANDSCRLCGLPVRRVFTLKVLRRHAVVYSRCSGCQSLQTEFPYWVAEAYDTNLSALDTGAAQRNLINLAAVHTVARAYAARNVLDWGGGDGLLCRLLRDYGLNCYVHDKYAVPTYGKGFDRPDFDSADLLVAFELLEHLTNPRSELAELFASNPKVLLVSTAIYADQGPDWWYLAPDIGQHVFFYSRRALEIIANEFDRRLVRCGNYMLFVRADAAASRRAMWLPWLLRPPVLRLISAAMRLMPTPGVWRDFESLKRRSDALPADTLPRAATTQLPVSGEQDRGPPSGTRP